MSNIAKKLLKEVFKNTIQRVANTYISWLVKREFNNQYFHRFNERSVEYRFVFSAMAKFFPRDVLDVGTGRTALPQMLRHCGSVVTAIDNVSDYWPFGMSNRHYHVIDDDITSTNLTNQFDLITCISVLEHVIEFNAAIKNMVSLLRRGGYLVLSFPYSEETYIPNVYDLKNSSYGQNAQYVTQAFSREELDFWCKDNKISIVEQEYWRFWEGPHWTVNKQIIPPEMTSASKSHQLTCILLKKNE